MGTCPSHARTSWRSPCGRSTSRPARSRGPGRRRRWCPSWRNVRIYADRHGSARNATGGAGAHRRRSWARRSRTHVVLLVTFARRLAKTIDEDPAATAAMLGQYRLAVARLLDVEPLPEPPSIDVLAELPAPPTPRLTRRPSGRRRRCAGPASDAAPMPAPRALRPRPVRRRRSHARRGRARGGPGARRQPRPRKRWPAVCRMHAPALALEVLGGALPIIPRVFDVVERGSRPPPWWVHVVAGDELHRPQPAGRRPIGERDARRAASRRRGVAGRRCARGSGPTGACGGQAR